MFFHTPQIDLDLLTLINQDLHGWLLNLPMQLLSSKTVFFIGLAIIAGWCVWKFGRQQVVLFALLLLAMWVTDLTTNLVKHQVGRVRPLNAVASTYFVEDGEWRQRPDPFARTKAEGTSYPSAHAANTACLAVLVMFLWPRVGRKALWLPLLVGISRVYLGKHYPTDVLAGWLFGGVIAGFS
ncbi:MAG: phosphatase PAP2 family protein, partial [Proteobacteria bacterium]|nr:phosphatase PAP2 family protein [Pseudomonadota bacterium]